MSNARPDINAMVRARAKIDHNLNKALVFLSPAVQGCFDDSGAHAATAAVYITALVKAAAAALRQFEDAAKGMSSSRGEAR